MLVAKHVCCKSQIAEQLVGLSVMLGPTMQPTQSALGSLSPMLQHTHAHTLFLVFLTPKVVLVWLHQHSEQLSPLQL